jgi:hypothetical protein
LRTRRRGRGPGETQRLANARLRHLAERILDDAVRTALTTLDMAEPRLLVPKTLQELERGWADLGPRLESATKILGEAVRTYLQVDPPARTE